MRRLPGFPLLVISVLLLVVNVSNAFAHATPMLYEPAAAMALDKLPPRVRIQFSEHIEPKASSITIYAPDGSRADLKDSRPDANDLRVLTVGVRDAGKGVYTVSWQVVSQDDGHFTKGGFSFGFGSDAASTNSTAEQIQVEHSSTYSQAGAIGIEVLGQSLLVAFLIAMALLWRRLPHRKITVRQSAVFERACQYVVSAGIVFIVLGVIVFLILKTLDLEVSRATSFATTFQTFLQTVDGRFAVYRLILGLAFGIYFFAVRKSIFASRTYSMHEGILAGLVAIILLDRAMVSHAAASHFHPDFSILMNAAHLLAKEFWVGGLMALSLILVPVINRIGRASWMAVTLTTMSKYISAALAVTALTGAYIVWLHLKSPAYILTTPWGRRFLVLSTIATILLLVRMYNQLFAERYAVQACRQHLQGYRREAVRWLHYSIPFEMCVGVALLFVTSYLIITTPPYPSERYALEKHADSQGARIAMTVHPVEQKQFLITVTKGQTGTAEPVTEMVVTLENMEKNIGPIVADTDERFTGGFTFPRNSLSVPGQWKIDITARRNGAYDAAVSFPLNYPAEFEASRIDPDVRVAGLFEGILASAAAAATLFSLALYRFAGKLSRQCDVEASQSWSTPGFRISKSILTGASATAAVCAVIWMGDALFIKSNFQRLCEDHGGSWTQSVPMRRGVTLSSETMAVCSTPSNDFHFAEAREFEYSLQKSPQSEEHHHQ